jgi:hypothetical protein
VSGAVEEVNHIFQDEGIGYELTPERVVEMEDGSSDKEYPKIIRKDTEYLHNEVIRPCLESLRRPGLEVAYAEMMKAHEEHRRGDYADAITDAASAFESVLKTICEKRGWDYERDTATCTPLVNACLAKNLFPSFYVTSFVAVGTIRNKISDAHGRGPKPLHGVSKDYADHMIQLTSSHITLLVKLAGL